jgi:hypothetical protein
MLNALTVFLKHHINKTKLMKYIIKYFRIALIVIIISISKQISAQITTPSETRKQAKVELKDEQKKEKVRRAEAEKAKAETEKNNAGFLDEKVSKKRKGKRSKPVKESKRREVE